jgi:NagD protein
METNVLCGVQLGFRTILVLRGGTKRNDPLRFEHQAHKIVDSIAALDPVKLSRVFYAVGHRAWPASARTRSKAGRRGIRSGVTVGGIESHGQKKEHLAPRAASHL